MKNVFIGLLIIAAGTGVYFFLIKKKNTGTEQANAINKELLAGKWKTVSYQPVVDSLQPLYGYDFQKDGIALRSASDTVKADTTHYSWNKENELVIKANAADTAGVAYVVQKLSADTLQVQSKTDKVIILLTKAK